MTNPNIPFAAALNPGIVPPNMDFDPGCTALGMIAIAAVLSDVVTNMKNPKVQHLMPNLLIAATEDGKWGATLTVVDRVKAGRFTVAELDGATSDLGQGFGDTPWEAAHRLMADLAVRHSAARGDIADMLTALFVAAALAGRRS